MEVAAIEKYVMSRLSVDPDIELVLLDRPGVTLINSFRHGGGARGHCGPQHLRYLRSEQRGVRQEDPDQGGSFQEGDES